ncbi:MAG TPA: YfiR/HmsC family protein, partial [Polyangiaceae bacterium]
FDSDTDAIGTALQGADLLTVSTVPSYVQHGIVLGFDLVSGHPKLLVHLRQARSQQVALRPEVLKLMRVYE